MPAHLVEGLEASLSSSSPSAHQVLLLLPPPFLFSPYQPPSCFLIFLPFLSGNGLALKENSPNPIQRQVLVKSAAQFSHACIFYSSSSCFKSHTVPPNNYTTVTILEMMSKIYGLGAAECWLGKSHAVQSYTLNSRKTPNTCFVHSNKEDGGKNH